MAQGWTAQLGGRVVPRDPCGTFSRTPGPACPNPCENPAEPRSSTGLQTTVAGGVTSCFFVPHLARWERVSRSGGAHGPPQSSEDKGHTHTSQCWGTRSTSGFHTSPGPWARRKCPKKSCQKIIDMAGRGKLQTQRDGRQREWAVAGNRPGPQPPKVSADSAGWEADGGSNAE